MRVWDLRDSAGNPVFQAQTKCVLGLTVDARDANYFAGYSDDSTGVVSVWDRRGGSGRNGATGPGWADPSLVFQRATVDENGQGGRVCGLSFSPYKNGVLGVLNTSGGLRVYEMAKLPDLLGDGGGIGSARDAAAAVVGSVFNRGGDDGSKRESFTLGKDSVSVGSSGGGSKNGEVLYVNRIVDVAAPPMRPSGKADKRICSFDWMSFGGGESHDGDGNVTHGERHAGDLKAIVVRNDGEIGVLYIPGSTCAVAVSGRNMVVASSAASLLTIPGKASLKTADTDNRTIIADDTRSIHNRRASDADYAPHPIGSPSENGKRPGLGGRDRKDSLLGSYLFPPEEVLMNDICVVMRQRVERGYGMDPEKSLKLVNTGEAGGGDALREMWVWVRDAVRRADSPGGMTAHYLDFNYIGVRQILNGDLESRYAKPSFRSREHQMKEASAACEELRKRLGKDDFISSPTGFHSRRSLALVVCGWHFNRSDLETQLGKLEKGGEYAKAAGWALFHNDIPRCIKALSGGGERMKLMSTAVAGYFAHLTSSDKSSTRATVWKDLCRSMSFELSDPYLRAVFAYVSNGEWVDVLDDVGLPIKERLGIAIRFLGDEELGRYVDELEKMVVKEGDLEGVVISGVGERFLELLGRYVDRTGDVQTAGCVASLVVPRYIVDEAGRVGGWVESYRELLNGWGMWKARGRFDVARGRRARRPVPQVGGGGGGWGGRPVGPNAQGGGGVLEVQRQIAVRCNTCDRVRSVLPPKLNQLNSLNVTLNFPINVIMLARLSHNKHSRHTSTTNNSNPTTTPPPY